MCAFFTCYVWTAEIPLPGRRAEVPLRVGTDYVADPVFYLKHSEGELIPPKVRGTPFGIPNDTITITRRAVNRNSYKSNEFPEILDK